MRLAVTFSEPRAACTAATQCLRNAARHRLAVPFSDPRTASIPQVLITMALRSMATLRIHVRAIRPDFPCARRGQGHTYGLQPRWAARWVVALPPRRFYVIRLQTR